MGRKSGKAGNAVKPAAPDMAEDADVATQSETVELPEPHKEPEDEESAEINEQTSWIEIELVGEDDKPIPGEPYKITLPNDKVASGTLDDKGFARVQGFKKGLCKVSFPQLDKDAWEKI